MTVMYYQMPDGEPVANVKTLLPNVSNPQNLNDALLNMLGVARVAVTQPELEWWQQKAGRVVDVSVTPHEMTWGVESRPDSEIRQIVASRSDGGELADAIEAVALARLQAGDDTPLAVVEDGEFVARTPADVLAEARSIAEGDYLVAVAVQASALAAENESVTVETVIENTAPGEWSQPQGAHDAYEYGAIVLHNGDVWQSLVAANVWEPGVSAWRNICTPSVGYPEWVQPTGGHDAYQVGERVTHDGKNWENTSPSNTYEPGVYGWVEID